MILGKEIGKALSSLKGGITLEGVSSNEIKKKVTVSGNTTTLTLDLPDYWKYKYYGVKGVGGIKADGSAWKKKRVTNKKFKYSNHMPPASAFSKYTSDKAGQFAIAKSIFHRGIETSKHAQTYDNPIEASMKRVLESIEDAVEAASLKNIKKLLDGFNSLEVTIK
tara:strand:+ start:3440 stop:3934 length:495 start_codon:yes stop_codon:yes gene_type:complete